MSASGTANINAMNAERHDIVHRLRDSATQARALDRSELLTEAADEIVKIRQQLQDFRGTPQAHATPGECSEPREGTVRLALTDAEREAVELACSTLRHMSTDDQAVAATLRGLLERMR